MATPTNTPSPVTSVTPSPVPYTLSFKKCYESVPDLICPPLLKDIDQILELPLKNRSIVKIITPAPYPKGLALTKIRSHTSYSCAFRLAEPSTEMGLKERFKCKRLGAGGFSKIYEGSLLKVKETGYKITPVAIAKMKIKDFNPHAIKHLKKLPKSPYLLARPIYFYQPESKIAEANMYMVMDLIKEKTDSLDLILKEQYTPKGVQWLIESTTTTAKAGAILASHNLVHGDIKLENMALGGLFDWGTLRAVGFDRITGVESSMQAPELVFHLESKNSPRLIERQKEFLSWYGKEAIDSLIKTSPRLKCNSEGYPLFYYTTMYDVFTLGMQWVRVYDHPSKWTILTPMMESIKHFLFRMIHCNPLDRPSMTEVAAFFDSLNTSTPLVSTPALNSGAGSATHPILDRYAALFPSLEPIFPSPNKMKVIFEKATHRLSCFKMEQSLPFPRKRFFVKISPEGELSCAALLAKPTEELNHNDRLKKEKLGEGISSKVYEGKILSISDSSHSLGPVAIAKINLNFFNQNALEILNRIPESPYLLGRPTGVYRHPSSPHLYVTMPLFKEKRDLFTHISEVSDDPTETFKLLVKGVKHAALGAALLHKHGAVHADIRFENMNIDGIFDWGSLHNEGIDILAGAPEDQIPPELLLPYYRSFKDNGQSPPPIVHETYSKYHEWYGKEAMDHLEALSPPEYNGEGVPSVVYTKAVDTFTLGMQMVRLYGDNHPSTWAIGDNHLFFDLQQYTLRMISFNPAERPSMEETAAFFGSLEPLASEGE